MHDIAIFKNRLPTHFNDYGFYITLRGNIEPLALQSFCAWISNITQDGILTLTFADMDITREAIILLEYFSERIITINYTHCTGVTEEHYKKNTV